MAEEILNTSGREPGVTVDMVRGLGIVPTITSPLLAEGAVLDAYAGPLSGSQGAPAAQPDYARNVSFQHTGILSTFPYTVTVTGLTGCGETETEDIIITGAGTFEGVKSWLWITDINLGGAGLVGADTADLNSGSVIGSPFKIYAAGDVCHVVKNGVAMQPASFTISTMYNTIEETGVAVGAGDEFLYFTRQHGVAG